MDYLIIELIKLIWTNEWENDKINWWLSLENWVIIKVLRITEMHILEHFPYTINLPIVVNNVMNLVNKYVFLPKQCKYVPICLWLTLINDIYK